MANLVLFKASIGNKDTNPVWTRYGISAAPALIILGKNGNEVDWILGFRPPVRALLIKIKESLEGIDTVRALEDQVAASGDDVAALCKLGAKYLIRQQAMNRSKELFERTIILDPQGKSGAFSPDWVKGKVTYTEYAEYGLAYLAAQKPIRDPKPLVDFLAKHPKSVLSELAQRALIPFLSD